MVEVIAVLGVFGIPLLGIWTSHQRTLLKMRMQAQEQGNASVQQSVNALREEMRALRDTTMQYDLSFDTAIQRMEQRMNGLERRMGQVEQAQGVQTNTVGK
jgi:hypothetical protein